MTFLLQNSRERFNATSKFNAAKVYLTWKRTMTKPGYYVIFSKVKKQKYRPKFFFEQTAKTR